MHDNRGCTSRHHRSVVVVMSYFTFVVVGVLAITVVFATAAAVVAVTEVVASPKRAAKKSKCAEVLRIAGARPSRRERARWLLERGVGAAQAQHERVAVCGGRRQPLSNIQVSHFGYNQVTPMT